MTIKKYQIASSLNNLLMITVILLIPVFCHALEPALSRDQSGWYQQAVSNIREMEYEVSWQDSCSIPEGKAGYHMANKKHDIRLYIYPEGAKAIRRTQSKPTWILGWSVSMKGTNKPQPDSKPIFRMEKNSLFSERKGIKEQYENLEDGIKQSVIIDENFKNPDSLTVSISLNGNMIPFLEPGDTEVEFIYESRAILGFKDFQVKDARGKTLPFHILLEQNDLTVSINDQDAVYPVEMIYLLAELPTWSVEPDVAEAQLGYSVCTAGDVNGDGYSDLIIGAPTYDNGQDKEGIALVYYGSPTGPSTTSDWSFESDQEGAYLGCSVSTAGDMNGDGYSDIVIGARYYVLEQEERGRVFLFYGSASGPGDMRLIDSSYAYSSFGNSVSTAGDINGDGYSDIIVGGEMYNNGYGVVNVFFGDSDGWGDTLWESFGSAGSQTGHSVRAAGDFNKDGYADIIVGANAYSNGQTSEGFVYLAKGYDGGVSASGWNYQPNQAGIQLGGSVSTAGDVNGDGYADVIVGAPYYSNGQTNEGAVFVFYGSNTTFSGAPDLILESNKADAKFGFSVSLAGDWDGDGYADIVVGAPGYQIDSNHVEEGAAYLYRGSETGLESTYFHYERSGQAGARYGASVSTAGDVNGDGYSDLIVGAPGWDGGQTDEGKCFLYYGEPSPPSRDVAWNTENSTANTDFALEVAGAGDVNGDGLSDIMVGAPLWDNGQTNEGRVFIYYGKSHDVPNTTPNRILESNVAGAYFGDALASAGDVNSDGYDDIIIGAPTYTNGQNFEGRVYMYKGSSIGIGVAADWVKEPNLENGFFGSSVAGAGDVNGDGYADIIIGMPSYPNGAANGRVYVYHGTSSGLTSTNRWNYICDQAGAFFGKSVASAGDVNADGYADIIIGATGYTNGETNEGRAYVFYGSHYGVNSNSPWIVESEQASAVFGQSVSSAGDTNGDGYSDVIIGAPYYDIGNTNEGAAFIYMGGSEGLSTTPHTAMNDAHQDNALFGYSVAGVGDTNGDGYSDVIVGAYNKDRSRVFPTPRTYIDSGEVYLYPGSPEGLSGPSDWVVYLLQDDANFGRCVAAAGDVNGDRFADIIIGAPGYTNDTQELGRAYLYLGGGGNGRLVLPLQKTNDESHMIGKMGRGDNNAFRMIHTVFSPFGRGKMKVEWETKLLGMTFTGISTLKEPNWWDITNNTSLRKLGISGGENYIFLWRVRNRYDPITLPYQPHGPWIFIPWNSGGEGDVRLGPDPDPTLQDIINYILGRSHYPHDINVDAINDAADVIDFIIP